MIFYSNQSAAQVHSSEVCACQSNHIWEITFCTSACHSAHPHILLCLDIDMPILLLLSSMKRPSTLHHHPQTVEDIFLCCACIFNQSGLQSQDFAHAHVIGLFMPNVSLFTINFPNHRQLSNSINHSMYKLSLTSHSAYHNKKHLCYCQRNLCHCFVFVTTMSLLCYISVKLTLVMIAFKLSFHQRL